MALFPFEYWSVCHLALCVYCFAAGHLRTCFTLHGCHWAFSWLLVVLLVVVCWHSIAAVCATGRKHDSIRHWTARDCLPFNFHFVILIFLKLCFIIQIGPFMLNKKKRDAPSIRLVSYLHNVRNHFVTFRCRVIRQQYKLMRRVLGRQQCSLIYNTRWKWLEHQSWMTHLPVEILSGKRYLIVIYFGGTY